MNIYATPLHWVGDADDGGSDEVDDVATPAMDSYRDVFLIWLRGDDDFIRS